MFTTPHLLVGAVVGAKVNNIGWIIILGIISHFIIDKIPHWDYVEDPKKFPACLFKKKLISTIVKLAIDGVIGLAILLLIILIRQKSIIYLSVGAFAAILPDIVLGIATLFFGKSRFFKYYSRLHLPIFSSGPTTKPTFFNVGTEILVILIAFLILIL